MEAFNILLGLCYLLRLCINLEELDESNNDSYLNGFSSKTAYRNSKLDELENVNNRENECQLVHINALFRHGTRYSSKKDMENIIKVHQKIMKSKTAQGFKKSFIDWKPWFSFDIEKKLSTVGYEEMMHLGQRFRKKFNKIDGKINVFQNIEIFSSSVERAKFSGAAFLQKFLQDEVTFKEAFERIKENDESLRFFDNCPHYTKSILKNNSMKIEYKKFSEGPEAQKVVEDIKDRWKLDDVDLTIDDVKSLFIMCGYEIALNMSSYMRPYKCHLLKDKNALSCPENRGPPSSEKSPLCSLLKPEHYPVFEYMNDLKHYWTKAYGSKINWLQSCDLMTTILRQIHDAVVGHQNRNHYSKDASQYFRGIFWFAHAETILPLSSLLRLFHQESPFTASNFQHWRQMLKDSSQRFKTFRVSNITPFAGNIAFELYYCSDLVKEKQSGYMIKIKSNEKTIKWSLGNDQGFISLEDLKNHLKLCASPLFNYSDVCVKGKGV